ncbi:MAG: VWA domain-containing protein [Rhodospirillales bacterium]|nr:VWA domain-containing protein [Rhodospirillales bacterium]
MNRFTGPATARAVAAILVLLFTASIAGVIAIAGPAMADAARRPLLIEGKTSLYQRVLTRPGATLTAKPGAGSGGTELAPMTLLFVYGRQSAAGIDYLEVGSNSEGKITGFVSAADTIPWKHSLVLAFTNPANRDRVLFYKDRGALVGELNSDALIADADTARRDIAAGSLPADSPVISIEPETFVDLQKQFYLLPILDASTTMLKSGFKVRTVQIASVTKEKGEDKLNSVGQRSNPQADLAKFNSGIVFVIDASASMQPSIDETRAVMDEVYREVEAAKLNDRVRFGLVAYRDDPTKVKGIGYLVRTFADPTKVSDHKQFADAVKDVAASQVSTRAYAEDGYAGVVEAIQGLDWSGFGGRYLILITDASSREGNSPLSTTRLGTAQVNQLAQENGIATYVLYLETEEGKADRATARAQYERLARFNNGKSLYFPVDVVDPQAFKAQVQKLAQALVAQVKDAGKAPLAAPTKGSAKAGGDAILDATQEVGRAMQLAYLGRVEGTKAPRMFEAWASDRDFRQPDVPAFSVRLLLTKNQLSDLQATLRKVVEAGEKGQINPSDFFNQLRSAAAAMSRDPNKVGEAGAKNLEDTGLMGEYLEGLPYQSKIMGLDQDTWARMGVGQQQALIDDVKSKIALYQRFHDDVDRWVQLNPAGAAGDAVYPVPLDVLP